MNDMNSNSFSLRFRASWQLRDDMVKAWVLHIALFLCLTQWITIGMAQSSTGPSNVPGLTSPTLGSGSFVQTPSTHATITNSDTASINILNSQSTETVKGRTAFSSYTSSNTSTMSSILYSDSTFYSVSTFSTQTVARSDIIFTSSSEALPPSSANAVSISKSSTLLESAMSDSSVFQTSSTFDIQTPSSSDQHSTFSFAPLMNSISDFQSSGSISRGYTDGTQNSATFSTSQLGTTGLVTASSENATAQPQRTSYVGGSTAGSTSSEFSRFESSSTQMAVPASGTSQAVSSNAPDVALHSPQVPSNTTAIKGQDSAIPIQSSFSTPSFSSVATLSTAQLLQPSGTTLSHQSTANVSSQPLQSSLPSSVLPSKSQSLQSTSLVSSLPSGTNLSSQSFKSSIPTFLLPSIVTMTISQLQQPTASAPSVSSVGSVSSQSFQSSLPTFLLPSMTTSQKLQSPPLASSLSSTPNVLSQSFQSSVPTSLLPSIDTMTTSQMLQPPTLASSLPSTPNVSSQSFQSSMPTPLLPSMATSQMLQLPTLVSSLSSTATVPSQSFQSSVPTSLLPPIDTMTTSQMLQPPTLASSLPSAPNVSSQSFQSSMPTPLLPSMATSQMLQLPTLVSSLSSTATVPSQSFQSSVPTSLLPPIDTMTTSQMLQPPTLASSLPSAPNVSSQSFQSSMSTPLLPSMATSQMLQLPTLVSSLSSTATVPSQSFQSPVPTSLLPPIDAMTTSQMLQPPTLASSLPSAPNVSSQLFQSSMPTSLLPSMATSQMLQPPTLASSFPLASLLPPTASVSSQSSQSSVLTSLFSSIATMMTSQLLQSPPTASSQSVATESFQSTGMLLKPSTTLRRTLTEVAPSSLEATAPTVSVHPSGSVTNRLFVGTTYGEVSLSVFAATSESVDALSSATSLVAPPENIVYSSLYPCWVSYFIERTVEVSAMYPNQTLSVSGLFTSTSSYSSAASFYTPVISEMAGSASEKSSNQFQSASSMLLGLSVYESSKDSSSLETPALSTSAFAADTIYSTARYANTVPSNLHSNTLVNNVPVSYSSLSIESIQSASIIASSHVAADSASATSLSALQSNFALLSATQAIPLSSMALSALPSLGHSSPSSAVASIIAKKRRRRAVLFASNGMTVTVADQSEPLSTAALTTQFEATMKTPGMELPGSISPSISQLSTVSSIAEKSTTVVTIPSESPLKSATVSLDFLTTSSVEYVPTSSSIQITSSTAPTQSSPLPSSQSMSPAEVVSTSADAQSPSSSISSQPSLLLESTTVSVDIQTISPSEPVSASSSTEHPPSTMPSKSSSWLESTTASLDSQTILLSDSVSASSRTESPSSTMTTQSSSLLESTTASLGPQSISSTESVSASSSVESPSSALLTQSSSLLESTTASLGPQSISPTESVSASSSVESPSSALHTQSSSLLESTTASLGPQSISPTASLSVTLSVETPSSTMLSQSSTLLETESVPASSRMESPSSTMTTQSSSLLEPLTISPTESVSASSSVESLPSVIPSQSSFILESPTISPTESVSVSSRTESPSSTMATQSSSFFESQTVSLQESVSASSSIESSSSTMPTHSNSLPESQTISVAKSVPISLNMQSTSSSVPIRSSSLLESSIVLPNSQTILPAESVQASSELQVSFSTVSAQSSSLLQPTSLSLDSQTNFPASSITQISSSAVSVQSSSVPQLLISLLESQTIPTSAADRISSIVIVPSSLLLPTFKSVLSTTGILDASTQVPLIQTSITSAAPTVLTSNIELSETLGTTPSSSYPFQETPVITLQTLSSSNSGVTRQPTPPASSIGGIVRLLTSSLGQCIAYYTSNLEPQISSTQSVDSTLRISSVGYTSGLEASMSSTISSLPSTEHSAALQTASTTGSLNSSSTILPPTSSKLSTSVYVTEIPSLFSNTISSKNTSTVTSTIFQSSSVFEVVSSASPMLNETAIISSMTDSSSPAILTPSLSETERSMVISTEASFLSSSFQASSSFQQTASSSPTETAQSPVTVYGSSSIAQMITMTTSLSGETPLSVALSSTASLQASALPTVQTVVPSNSLLPSAASALDPVISNSTFLATVADSSFVSTQDIRLSVSLPVSNMATSAFSVRQYTPTSRYIGTASFSTSQKSLLTTAAPTTVASSLEFSGVPQPSATTPVQVQSIIVVTQPTQPPQAFSIGLCRLLLSVSPLVDVSTSTFKLNMETKLLNTYLVLKLKRKRRAVTQGTTTLNVTSITRQGSTQNVETQFYITENNVVVGAETTSSTFNQLTTAALSARLNQTVASSVNVVSTTTQTPGVTTITPPTQNQLLGMVLTDSLQNNISTGNNKLLFENRMADYYKAGRSITGAVIFTVYYIKHEEKNVVYLEFFVSVSNTRQNASVVASFYSTSSPPVSTAALSALLQYSVLTLPYSITSFTASDTYQVVMTIRPVNASINLNTDAFKSDFAQRITTLYREGKNTAVARRKRRALGSISTTILSISSTTDNKATVKFFVLDQAVVVIGVEAAKIINRVGINRMSSLLGVEVVVLPAAVSVAPVPATSEPALWIIGVVIGSVFVMLLFFACLYWRWKVGGPQQKLDLEKIQMAEKGGAASKPYGGYKEIASYTAEGRSEGGSGGGGGLKTTAFIEPSDANEKPDMTRSTRRKGRPNEAVPQPVKQRYVNGRANVAYEQSEEEYEDDEDDEEDEDEEDEDDYEETPPRKPEPPRPVSAQRRVEVQPGPSRPSNKVVEKMQHRAETEDQVQENREMPVAAELPPLSKMKDVQEAPSYPPVRFRTSFEPEASTQGHLPPIFQHKSLTGRPLPDMDPELRQKADLERSRNKQRQRLRVSGKRTDDASPMEVSTKDRKAWRKAQNEIDALLDPFSATLKRSPRSTKRAKRRHRLRRSHKVDIAIDGPKKADESKSVKLNNYMSLENPYSSETERSNEMTADSENEKNIEDAKERIHSLLDDAFSLLGTSPRAKKQTKDRVYEEIEVKKTEAELQQAPPESETERSRYPALPPPPHGRATTPLRGERKRILNYPNTPIQNRTLPPNDSQALAPVLTRDPMVVMDRGERNRYLSQRHGHPEYSRPYNSPSYPYSGTPSAQPVFITPVQQQPDGLSGVIWSPYTTEVIRDDVKNSTEFPLNAIGSPGQDRYNAKIPQNISTIPKPYEPMRQHHTSIDMSNPLYDSQLYGSSPQPLIRAIKDELLRLSRSARGKTEIQDLRTSQDQGHSPFT